MFTTKKDVDKHVRTGFAKLRTENEKNLRGLSVAKLYAKIGEYQSALHYVCSFLAVREDSAQAHRLAGQCHERLKRADKAIASYQRSLQLDAKQSDLLIDVCKLLLTAADGDPALGRPGTLRYWCDMADAQRVQHEAVVNLRMRLMRRDDFSPQQVDEMLQHEIAAKPYAVALRIQLVQHMLEQQRLDEAFKYVNELEQKRAEPFAHSLDWYGAVATVLAKLDERDVKHNWSYWVLAVQTAERQVFLTLCAPDRRAYAPAAQLGECAALLHHLDQTLDRAVRSVATSAPSGELAAAFGEHFGAQLCLHAAALVYRRQLLQKLHWRDTQKAALPLLLLALNGGGGGSGTKALDAASSAASTEPVRQLVRHWRREAAFRGVQAGRTLLSHVDAAKRQSSVVANIRKICASDKTGLLCTTNEELLAQIRQYCADDEWRRQVHATVFAGLGVEKLAEHTSSFLVRSPALAQPQFELLCVDELAAYAESAQHLQPASLALQVYLALGQAAANGDVAAAPPAALSDHQCKVFDGLNVTAANLVNCSAETLSQLDADAVLFATVLQTQQRLLSERACEQQSSGAGSRAGGVQRPYANVASSLATAEQTNWWSAAFKVYKNTFSADVDLSEVRATIQHGLEAVRGVGAPKMDTMIGLRLGQIFAARAAATTKPSERQALDARVDALFKYALHLVRMRANGSLGEFRPLFRYQPAGSPSAFELECALNAATEEAITYVASRYFQAQAYQECIDELHGIQLPFATYFVSEAYRQLELNSSATTPRKNRRAYLEMARDALQQTLELLDYPHVDKNHALKSIVHDDIRVVQQQLNKVSLHATAIGGDLSFTNGSGARTGGDGGLDELNDSIVSQNGAGERTRRSLLVAQKAAAAASPRHDELKELMNAMMEQLTLVQDDMIVVRTRLGNIEDQLNRRPEPPPPAPAAAKSGPSGSSGSRNNTNSIANHVDDYYLLDELNQPHQQQQQQSNYNQNPYGAFGGRQGVPPPQQQQQQQQQPPPPPHALNSAQMAALMSGVPLNPYQQTPPAHQSTPPFYGNMYQQMATMRNAMMPGQYIEPNAFGTPYGMAPTPQAPNFMNILPSPGLPFAPPHLQQQQQQQPLPIPSQPIPIQQPSANISTTLPPLAASIPATSSQPQANKASPPFNQTPPAQQQVPPPQAPPAKIWNAAANNAPVEKGPPVNVVITSSDPLPLFGKSTTASASGLGDSLPQTLSVTIPPHHIKNSAAAAAAATLASTEPTAANAAPAFGGFIKTPQSLTKSADKSAATPAPVPQQHKEPAPKQTTTETPPKSGPFGALNLSASNKDDKTGTPAKPSPFASFAFGTGMSTTSASTTNIFGSISTGAATATAASPFANTSSVASPAAAAGGGLFSSLTATKSVASAPKLSSPAVTPKKDDNAGSTDNAEASGGADGADDDYVPTAHFEPVIALPDLVETKTGEEEEHVRFEHRAKLLRFVRETKEWKERGIGQMKVLVNKQDASKVRLLMRREQVLKLCCNQLLTADTEFKPLGTAGTSRTWFGQDYSENELQVELLAIRFKTAETCQQFYAAVLEAQKNMSGAGGADSQTAAAATPAIAPAKQSDANASEKSGAANDAPKPLFGGFGDKFKSASGSWDCSGCYVTNKPNAAKCVACNAPAPGATTSAAAAPAQPKTAADAPAPLFGGFGDKFKAASGSWDCSGCYVTNKPNTAKCVACNAAAPGATAAPASAATTTVTAAAPATTSSNGGFGNMFKPKSGAWECKDCYISNAADAIYCVACNSPKDDMVPTKPATHALLAPAADAPKFSFGVPMAAATTTSAPAAAEASFAAPTPAFSFGTFTAMTSTSTSFGGAPASTSTPAAKSGFSFSLNGGAKSAAANETTISAAPASTLAVNAKIEPKETFSFVFKPKSPIQAAGAGIEAVSDDEDGANIEEENTTYFAPVIPLPDRIDVVTGEEDEEVLYSHRAKLYKFTDSEWKERGLGDVKILCHRESGKLRVVMRRDVIHKICLNHALTEDIDYQPKGENSWHFVANDYSDNTVELLQFCLRFKTAAIAKDFKQAAAKAVYGDQAPTLADTLDKSATSGPDDDKRLAEQLKLPAKFYNYRKAPACKGCRGCKSDEFVFPDFSNLNESLVDAAPLPLVMPIMSNQPTSSGSANASVVKQSTFSFGTPSPAAAAAVATTPTAGGNLFAGSTFNDAAKSIFGGGSVPNHKAPEVPNPFGSPSPFSVAAAAGGKSAIFGGDIGTTKGNIFASATTTTTSTIFGSGGDTQKPLPTKSFAFGSPFGGTTDSPFPLPATTADTTNPNTATTTGSTTGFSFGLTSSTTNAANAKDPTTPKPFSFALASNDTTTEPTTEAPAPKPMIFGGAAVFKPADKDVKVGNIFGTAESALNTSATNASSGGGTNFGGVGGGFSPLSGNAATGSSETALPFKDTGISFASISSASTNAAPVYAFGASPAGGFFGLSKKDDFTSFQRTTTATNESGGGDGSDVAGGEDPSYDPHYDPIIELPDEIEVKTGEEDEEKVFAERAKLFRYDATNREWKERGVGELKILRHKTNDTYRILLRREQVFKLVLNHALTADVNIAPMQSSDKAFCWATNNYSDDAAGVAEQLSVRFKNADIGAQFDKAVKLVQAKLRLHSD